MSRVLRGERTVPPGLVRPLAKALDLDPEDTRTLGALVDLESETLAVRRGARAYLEAVRRFHRSRALGEGDAALFGHWWIAAILELARCVRLPEDPAVLAGLLDPPIEPAQAAAGVATLLARGLLLRAADGRLVPADAGVASPVEIPPGPLAEAVGVWHLEALARAQDALFLVPARQRHHACVLFAVGEADLAELRERQRAFERELMAWMQSRPTEGGRVYQLSFALFPVSAAPRHGGGTT